MLRATLCFLLLVPCYVHADENYDLVIRNGKIIDGTGNPWFYADVAIRDDRIVAIGKLDNAEAKRTIDAKGLVVAPGFIDMHSHSDYLLLEDGNAESKIRQGVTTEVLGEGNSAGPYQGELPARRIQVGDEVVEIRSLGDYFDTVERAGISTNICSYVGINNVWRSVMGSTFDRPTAEQINQMKKLVDGAMRDGAMGLSSQVVRWPRRMILSRCAKRSLPMAEFIPRTFATKAPASLQRLRKRSRWANELV